MKAMATTLVMVALIQAGLEDRDVKVRDTSVHVRCGGARGGGPLVVLESGAGGTVASWQPVHAEVAAFARVCAYDRPATGASGPPPAGLTAASYAQFLRDALIAAGEKPPYLMVGHSFGGLIGMLYAEQRTSEIAGLVLVDSSHEDQSRRMEPVTGPPPPRKIPPVPPPGVPPPPPPGLRFDDFASELRRTPFRRDVPIVVLTAARPPRNGDAMEAAIQPIWLELQKELASRSSRSAHVILPDSGHLIPRDDPKAVVDAVRRVMNWR
jgi:pimeloyl-ACP methyl ester carboxylesterase